MSEESYQRIAPVLNPGDLAVTVIGHPFSTVGMGEQMRAGISALRAVQCKPSIHDIYKYSARSDQEFMDMMGDDEIQAADISPIRIFHINGDEINPALRHMEAGGFQFNSGYNVIVPAWELPKYPEVWREDICKFDEIWASSKFILQMFADYPIPAYYVGQSVEIGTAAWLPRRFFGIRESAFVLLSFYDTTSYATRKNPSASVALLRKLIKDHPHRDIQLVLKVKSGDQEASTLVEFDDIDPYHLKILTQVMTRYEARSLINTCDCLVSLHRSEGFGRGCGEAMYLQKLALGTNWSGVADFMNASNSLAVPYELVPVHSNAYPHSEGQLWAEADILAASELVGKAIEDSVWAAQISCYGNYSVRTNLSDLAVGIRMLERASAATLKLSEFKQQ